MCLSSFRSHLSVKLATPICCPYGTYIMLICIPFSRTRCDPPAAAVRLWGPTYRAPVPSGVNLTGRRGKFKPYIRGIWNHPQKIDVKKHKTIASLECRSLFRPEGGDSQLDWSRFICKVYLHSASQAGRRMPAHTHTHTRTHMLTIHSRSPHSRQQCDPLGRTLFA